MSLTEKCRFPIASLPRKTGARNTFYDNGGRGINNRRLLIPPLKRDAKLLSFRWINIVSSRRVSRATIRERYIIFRDALDRACTAKISFTYVIRTICRNPPARLRFQAKRLLAGHLFPALFQPALAPLVIIKMHSQKLRDISDSPRLGASLKPAVARSINNAVTEDSFVVISILLGSTSSFFFPPFFLLAVLPRKLLDAYLLEASAVALNRLDGPFPLPDGLPPAALA